MKTQLVITDLTRMQRGRVCIAGYTPDGCCIRPVLPPPGIPESSLVVNGRPVIYPFAQIELRLVEPKPQPPHTEDYLYDPWSVRHLHEVSERRPLLDATTFPGVAPIFDQPVLQGPGYYVLDCQGARSLGTVQPSQIHEISYSAEEDGVGAYRMSFVDFDQKWYKLKVTDLTFQYYCRSLRNEITRPEKIARKVSEDFQQRQVYLRIGLARGWAKYPERCFLQITGIYTFPDYLQGKTFYNFLDENHGA